MWKKINIMNGYLSGRCSLYVCGLAGSNPKKFKQILFEQKQRTQSPLVILGSNINDSF